MITYTLTRSKRKTTAIYVRDGKVEVRAPLHVPVHEIDRFVSEKEEWILKCLSTQHLAANKKENFMLNYDSSLTFRGSVYPIAQREGKRAGFDGEVFYLPPGLSSEQIKATCIEIYKMLAKAHISSRVAFYSAQMKLTPASVKINSAMKRWGSCSSQKSLNFSWRLIMADDNVIDYVVVHELAHLKEMNHSARFWAIVEGILPNYRECKVKLKDLQRHLYGENWG